MACGRGAEISGEGEADDALLARAAAGDGAAARILALRHLPRVLAVAERMLGERAEAEDIAQEAMLRLWRRAEDWQPDGAQLSTWLYRVAANLAIDRLRRRRPGAPLAVLEALPDPGPGAETALARRDRAAALDAALLALPERQRLAIVLRHIEELPQEEVASVMELSVEAVESLLSRGRRSLRAMLLPQRAALGLEGG
ncbi:MAG TPA: RNA polymerase sigma factor [Paracoccaceae bacterium]|nr:RNA polymerase sigma factor [Paracoccaceae bacterium]